MKTILIVEDDKNLQITLSHILKEEGYDVITTMWGSMAIEEVKKGIPDLVLLDIMLPGMNGMQVLEKVKKIEKSLPVIMITGYGSTESAIRAIELGAYDYINKPFDYEKLIFKISNAILKSRHKKRGFLLRQLKRFSLDFQEYKDILVKSSKK